MHLFINLSPALPLADPANGLSREECRPLLWFPAPVHHFTMSGSISELYRNKEGWASQILLASLNDTQPHRCPSPASPALHWGDLHPPPQW